MASIEWALRVTFFPPQLIPKILPASSAKKTNIFGNGPLQPTKNIIDISPPQEHGVSVGVSFMWSTKQKSDNKNS